MFRLTAVHFVHFVIVTGLATTNLENSTLRDRIPVYLHEVCPGRGVCLNDDIGDVIDSSDGTFSCCGTCSCSVDCEAKGNCCFQNHTKSSTGHNVTSSRNNKECLYPVSKPQNEAFPLLVLQSYNMISSSPDDAVINVRTNTSVTCGDVNVGPWGSMLPVYSKQTGNIYKNRVCAEAFNVTDGEEWSVHLSCEPPSDQYDAASFVSSLQDGFLHDYCLVKFVFEGEMAALRSHICYKTEDFKINECASDFFVPPFTTASREDIVAACKSGLVSPYKNTVINVFCFICENKGLTRRQCSSDVSSRTVYTPFSFVSIVDTSVYIKKSEEVHVKSRNSQMACPVDTVLQDFTVHEYKEGNIYITYRSMAMTGISCRVISCPSGQILNQDNRCVYTGDKWIMENILIQILLTSEEDINIELISDPLKNFQSPWPKSWTIRTINVATQTESQTRLIIVRQYATFHSPFNPKYFFHNTQKYINKPWLLTLNNGTIKLTAELSKSQSILSYGAHSSIKLLYRQYKFVRIKTLITELYFCDHVTLIPSEYSLTGQHSYVSILNKITNETLLDGEFAVVDKRIGATVEVCLEKSGFARVSPNGSPWMLPHHLLIQCICTVYFIIVTCII